MPFQLTLWHSLVSLFLVRIPVFHDVYFLTETIAKWLIFFGVKHYGENGKQKTA
jgi:hypothetical protein